MVKVYVMSTKIIVIGKRNSNNPVALFKTVWGDMSFFINSYLFIPSTISQDFAVISTHAGRKPLLIALRTDLTLHQAAQ